MAGKVLGIMEVEFDEECLGWPCMARSRGLQIGEVDKRWPFGYKITAIGDDPEILEIIRIHWKLELKRRAGKKKIQALEDAEIHDEAVKRRLGEARRALGLSERERR
jgi:hypothetical protein